MCKAILPVAGIAALAVALVGCGSGGTSTGVASLSPSRGGSPQQAAVNTNGRSGPAVSTSAGGPCRPREYLSFCEKIHITGAVTVDGTGSAVPQFDQGPVGMAQQCATWPSYQPRKPDDHDLTLPDDPVDGHKVLMLWPFAAGVGASDIAGYAGSNSIAVDGVGFLDVAADVSHTTASSGQVRVNPDGSGSLTFKDLVGRAGKISGLITWTCVDRE
jgi:hypothetical protein